MTAINAVSSAVYLKGFTIREKAQTYALAVIFLVLLYNSPSGLVLYWTLNNLFSLVKNIVQRRRAASSLQRPSTFSRQASKVLGLIRSAVRFIDGLLDAVAENRAAMVVYRTLAMMGAAFALYLIVYSMMTWGKPGRYRLTVLLLSVCGGALPWERGALKGDKRDYVWHTVCAAVLAVTALSLSVTRCITNGNPGKYRTSLFIASVLWLVSVPFINWYGVDRVKGKARELKIICREAWLSKDTRGTFALLFASCAGLALLLGLVLPSSVIATSPGDFCFIGKVDNPLYYVARSLCVFAGMCVLWPVVLYRMSSLHGRIVMAHLASFMVVMALLNVYVFGFNYGMMDAVFRLHKRAILGTSETFYTVLPFVAGAAVIVMLALVFVCKWVKYATVMMTAVCVAGGVLGAVKTRKIADDCAKFITVGNTNFAPIQGKLPAVYHLSKDGKNVAVLFLDRAISSFFPYIVRQFPQLAQQFDGFVYYPNTVSFSSFTTKASPAMMGGYEYTPENANKRSDEFLVDKHNEATLVASKLFLDAGWQVTVTDPPFGNYDWYGDLAPFQAYHGISCSFEQRRYTKRFLKELEAKGVLSAGDDNVVSSHTTASRIVPFAIMQAAFPIMRNIIYDDSEYLQSVDKSKASDVSSCHCIVEFAHMHYLPDITDCTAQKNSYIFICNDLTHSPSLLKEPGYEVANGLDESKATAGYYKWKLNPTTGGSENDLAHYHVNAAAMLQTARWLDKLREMNVYDNTRIIIVSDHGRGIPTPAFDGMKDGRDYAFCNPLLIVKDFDAHGAVRTDNTFMTNADTLLISRQGLSVSDINPFTGKNLYALSDKSEVHIYPAVINKKFNEADTGSMRGKKLWMLDGDCRAYSVHDNIFDEHNWRVLDDTDDASASK